MHTNLKTLNCSSLQSVSYENISLVAVIKDDNEGEE